MAKIHVNLDGRTILVTGSPGFIGANLVLVVFKMIVGLAANSIAVILDAVNNLSDALSSVITIIGTKLAGRRPDKKHPFGHGRIEYITSVIIAVIVLVAGATSLWESIQKIINPTAAEYTVISLIIIAVAIVVKIVMGIYVKSVGKQINSQALIGSGSDAMFDAVLSAATLVAAAVSMIWHLNLEGWLGAVISIFIIKSGIEILMESLNSIIGVRAEKELTDQVKELACKYPEVHGVYDVLMHNYGPAKTIGSIHIEVDSDMTAGEIHKLTRHIVVEAYEKLGVILTVGIYANDVNNEDMSEIRRRLEEIAQEAPEVVQVHGFYFEESQNLVTFDIIVDFSADADKVKDRVVAELKEEFPQHNYYAIIDTDFSESEL